MEVDLISNIKHTKEQLNVAIKNFENAEGEMIDYYIYEIKAIKAKLSYFISIAKKHKMELEKKQVI